MALPEKPMQGQTVKYDGKVFKFKGGDPADSASWEEVGNMENAARGFKGAWDKAAYGLKGLFTDLTPEDKQQLDINKGSMDTKSGRLGGAAFDVAATWPAFGAVAGAASAVPASLRALTGLAGSGAVGGAYGAVTNPEDRFKGAQHGALWSMLGNAVGEGTAGFFRPQAGTTAAALMADGARLTPGQAAGGLAKVAEDASRTINPAVAQRQREGIGDWNRSMVNAELDSAGLPKVQGIGHQMIDDAKNVIGKEYDRVGTPMIKGDAQYTRDLAAVSRRHTPFLTPAEQDLLKNYSDVATSMANGQKNTAAFRQLENELSAEIKNSSGRLGSALGDLKTSMEGLRGRFGNVTPELDKANARFSRMKEAAADQRSMDTGIFSPGQLRGKIARKATVNQRATGKAGLQDEVAAAEDVLGSSIPAVGPGTAEKGFFLMQGPGMIASALTQNPTPLAATLGLYGLNKLAYTPQGVRFLTGQYPPQMLAQPTSVQGALPAFFNAFGQQQ